MRFCLMICLLICVPSSAQEKEKGPDQLFQELVTYLNLADNIQVIAYFQQSKRVQLSYQNDRDRIDVQLDFYTVLPPSWAKRQNHFEVEVPFVGHSPNKARLQFSDRTTSVLCYRAIRDLAASFGSVNPDAIEPEID